MNENTEEDNLARSIEDGTYYTAARRWYSDLFHHPIAERSYYIIVGILSVLSFYFTLSALIHLLPIKQTVPFPIYTENVWTKWPHTQKLSDSSKEDKNVAVMLFLVKNYVINRESYDLGMYELRYRIIWNNSSASVFDEYKHQIDASNPLSPYRQYTDAAKRNVEIQSVTYDREADISRAHVIYRTYVVSSNNGKEISSAKWQADIAYQYTDFKVDQKLNTKNAIASFFGLTEDAVTGSGEKRKIVPMTFVVSEYKSKELFE